MPTLYRHKNKNYYVVFWHNGVQHRKSLRTSDRRTARTIFDDFSREYHRGKLGLAPEHPAPTLGQLFDAHLIFSRQHKAPRTAAHHEIYVEKFLRPVFGHLRADALTDEQVEAFITQMRTRTKLDKEGKVVPAPYHPETINKRLKFLAAVLRRAVRNKELPEIPIDMPRHYQSAPRPLPRYITPEDFGKWYAKINKPLNRCRAVIALCTGIPDSELGRFTWKDNYREEMNHLRYKRAKTDFEIVVGLNEWAREAMEELKAMRRGPYIFHGVRDMKRAYQTASAASGIHATPYTLRHSFATWALSQGEDLAKISAILGHADLRTTQIYARVMPQFLVDTATAIDKLRSRTEVKNESNAEHPAGTAPSPDKTMETHKQKKKPIK